MSGNSPENRPTRLPTQAGEVPQPGPPLTTVANGRYEIKRMLGEGGQKRVYLAFDRRLKRDVVIAILKSERSDAEVRLLREAEAMARLGDHPNIVTVYDVVEEHGRACIVSQYIDGGSVASLLGENAQRRLPFDRALHIAEEACRALNHAHGRGIVHRDVKPANLWLTRDGAIKLGDFGLALHPEFFRMTGEGIVVGTVAYMSPEQLMGGRVDARSDLYSLGATLYEMIAGRVPFDGDDIIAVVSQHLQAVPVAPSWMSPDIPTAADRLVLQLLSKAPEDRLPSAQAVLEEISAIRSGAVTAEPRESRSLDRLAGGVFVGRERDIGQLRARLDDVLSGTGQLVMVSGEPGSGKTSLTEQLATYARLRNVVVLRGQCHEGEGAPAFWPWVQVLRCSVVGHTAETLMLHMGAGASDIAHLDSEVRRQLPATLPDRPQLEPEQARFRLFDSVTTFLKNLADSRPALIVLEDLHWADRPSLLLLQFLTRELKGFRVMVIGTYRDAALGPQHPLTHALGDLSAKGFSHRIILHGLAERDVARFIELITGIEPPERLVHKVFRETDGNPFFLTEVVRLLVSDGRLDDLTGMSGNLGVPEGVREVIRRRVSQLPDDCTAVLRVAAAIGREFHFEVLKQVTGYADDRLLTALDAAVSARIIGESPEGDRYRFTHALMQASLYTELSAGRQARLHRQIGARLEALYSGDPEPHLEELAYHFTKALPTGDADKVVSYCVRAAERADRQLAYEEAANYYEMALRVPVDRLRQAEITLALGHSQSRAGFSEKARQAFMSSANAARELGAWDLFASAVLAVGTGVSVRATFGTPTDEQHVAMLQEALGHVGSHNSSLRAHLLAQLTLALYRSPAKRLELSEQAVTTARLSRNATAQLASLYSRCVALEGYPGTTERLELATELVHVAESVKDHEAALRGRYRRAREFLEVGDMEAAERELELYTDIAKGLRQPGYEWYAIFTKAALAVFRCHFAEGERLKAEAIRVGQRAQDPNVMVFVASLSYVQMAQQGRFQELAQTVSGLVTRFPMMFSWRSLLALTYCRLGRQEDARVEFERLASREFDDLARDGGYTAGLVGIGIACALLGDRRRAPKLYDMLLPFGALNLVSGNALVCGGAVAACLGRLALVQSQFDEAERHFRLAIDLNTRMRAPSFLAEAKHELGCLLLDYGGDGDIARARVLLQEALDASREFGLLGLLSRTEAVMRTTFH